MPASVKAIPHDLLKVLDWRRHTHINAIPQDLGECFECYKTSQLDIEGRPVELTLRNVIEGHHSTERFWEKMLSYSDMLSAMAGRFRMEYDYWRPEESPFLVKVYGDIRVWERGEREGLWRKILEVLRKHKEEGIDQAKAYEEINDLLGEFPSDSRFPYTSLKTHHWLADSIRGNRRFWEEVRNASRDKREPVFERMYLVRLSIASQEFHRAKELRAMEELKSELLGIASKDLSAWSPLRIGDDLYLVCLDREEVDEVLGIVKEKGFDVDIYDWGIEKKERLLSADGKRRRPYTIKRVEHTPLSTAHEELDYDPRSYAEYSRILEEGYEYVAWIYIAPKEDIAGLAQCFLEWGEGVLKERYGGRRRELAERYEAPAPFLSPDLALAIAEGFDEFLSDCERVIRERRGGAVVRAFGRSLFVCGLGDESEGFDIYSKLSDLRADLHIPICLCVIVSKPKHPFWRVAEFSERLKEDGLIFLSGERVLNLSDEDVSLLRKVSPALRNVSRNQFREIIKRSSRLSLEELKFLIEGKAADGKIPFEVSKKICWMIDELSRRYEGDELRAIIRRALRALSPYTRFDRRG